MGHTIIEKIIGKNIGREVKPGDIVTVNVDRVMIHDIFIPFVKEKFEEMGFTKIWDPDKAVLIYDHLVPASQVDDTRHFRIGNEFVEKYGMKNIPALHNLPLSLTDGRFRRFCVRFSCRISLQIHRLCGNVSYRPPGLPERGGRRSERLYPGPTVW